MQTVQSLNAFISSLQGQLYYPVTGAGVNVVGSSSKILDNKGSSGSDLGTSLLNGVPPPPTFNLETPQSITGFGP